MIDNSDYTSFINNIFYKKRDIASEEPGQTAGNAYYRNSGKVLLTKYNGDNLYLTNASLSVDNFSAPQPMMAGYSSISTAAVLADGTLNLSGADGPNFDQDIFSTKYPKRTLNLSGLITKNSLSWKSIIHDSIYYTLINGKDIYQPIYNSTKSLYPFILKSANIKLSDSATWSLSVDTFDKNCSNLINFSDNSNTDYSTTESLLKDLQTKWYEVFVVIPTNTHGLYDKVKYLQNPTQLYFYSNNLYINFDITYDPIYILSNHSEPVYIPYINIKRITMQIELEGFTPIGNDYIISMLNIENTNGKNITDFSYTHNDLKYNDISDISIHVLNNASTEPDKRIRIDNIIPWNKNPFNLVNKFEINLSPNDPAKLKMSITKIYS